jgi:hypothetical protein
MESLCRGLLRIFAEDLLMVLLGRVRWKVHMNGFGQVHKLLGLLS